MRCAILYIPGKIFCLGITFFVKVVNLIEIHSQSNSRGKRFNYNRQNVSIRFKRKFILQKNIIENF